MKRHLGARAGVRADAADAEPGRGTDEPGVHHDGAIWNFSRDGRRQRNVVSHCSWELGRF